MKEIKCNKCGETDITKFYSSSIKKSNYMCKSCLLKYNTRWFAKNKDKWREYWRVYMANHPKYNRKSQAKWYALHKDRQYSWRLAYIRQNPQRHRAQNYALLRYPEPQICEIEGCFKLGERHHGDYSKPYDIKWLCRKHHKELHAKLNKVVMV